MNWGQFCTATGTLAVNESWTGVHYVRDYLALYLPGVGMNGKSHKRMIPACLLQTCLPAVGSFPEWLCRIPKLIHLDVARNGITGETIQRNTSGRWYFNVLEF